MKYLRWVIPALTLCSALAGPAAASPCEALRAFVLAADTAEVPLVEPYAALERNPKGDAEFKRFAEAFRGAYAKSMIAALELLAPAYPEKRVEIRRTIARYPEAVEQLLAQMQEGLQGDLGAANALSAALAAYDPLGDELSAWIYVAKGSCPRK